MTGLFPDYDLPAELRPAAPSAREVAGAAGFSWDDVLDQWIAVEADLHDVYGFDVGAPGALASRTGRWLRVRLAGLVGSHTRTSRALAASRGAPPSPPRR